MGAILIGAASGVFCFLGATTIKKKFGYDDSLDAFGVHGIGGIVGAFLTGICASPSMGGLGMEHDNMGAQVKAQVISIIVTLVYSGVLSLVILKIVDVVIGLRVPEEEEEEGLDISLHNERGYDL